MMTNRRDQTDRRKKPTPPFSQYSFRGRRQASRRSKERYNYYVDKYEPRYLFLVISVVLLCCMDALLTLELLQNGAIEMNPFMDYLIKKDAVLFFLVKLLITSVNVLVLLIHKNFLVFGKIKLRSIIYSVFVIYIGLIGYELLLYFRFVLK